MHLLHLLPRELKHEVGGKLLRVPSDGLVERPGFHAINRREVGGEDDLLPADGENLLIEQRQCFGFGFRFHGSVGLGSKVVTICDPLPASPLSVATSKFEITDCDFKIGHLIQGPLFKVTICDLKRCVRASALRFIIRGW